MRAAARTFVVVTAAAAVCGCGGASPASGITAYLRLTGAQFVPGALEPAAEGAGPVVANVKSSNSRVFPGAQGRAISGSLGGTARAVRIGLGDDSGHWLLPAGVEDLESPGNFVFQSRLSFSPDLPLGARALIFRAVDAAGEMGPAQVLALKVESPVPAGALVISLLWDTEADLDLHVLVPNTADPAAPYQVWSKAPLALPPRASSDPPPASDELRAAGQLDVDSNSGCAIDGRRQENLIFPQAPPAGDYQVRVDAFALCGQVTARWHALAVAGDVSLGEALGQVTDLDTARAHGAAAGTLAFTFSISPN